MKRYLSHTLVPGLALALALACGKQEIPEAIANAVANPARPAEERSRDANRKPAETLSYLGLKAGMRVGEMMAGSGYYTEILVAAVGHKGAVFAHNHPFVPDEPTREAWQARLARLGTTVTALETEPEQPGFPASLDMVLLVSAYHDLHWQEVDLAKVNQAAFRALKPGGTYGIIDYRAVDGSGTNEALRLHRIDPATVKTEVTKAGFEFAGSSSLLEMKDDNHTSSIYADGFEQGDLADRFVFRFKKPK